jgi:hypothetical protein
VRASSTGFINFIKMKKIIIILCMVISIRSINAQEITPNSVITSELLQGGKLKNAILDYIKANTVKLNTLSLEGKRVNFDFENLRLLKSDNIWTNVVSSYELTNDPSRYTSEQREGEILTLGFVMENGKVLNHFISQTINTKSEKNIKLFDRDFNQLYKVNIDEFNKNVSIETANVLNNRAATGCGQATMNCISHHYTSNGWWSVGLWIATGFYPGVGVAVAAACGATCCLNIGCPS